MSHAKLPPFSFANTSLSGLDAAVFDRFPVFQFTEWAGLRKQAARSNKQTEAEIGFTKKRRAKGRPRNSSYRRQILWATVISILSVPLTEEMGEKMLKQFSLAKSRRVDARRNPAFSSLRQGANWDRWLDTAHFQKTAATPPGSYCETPAHKQRSVDPPSAYNIAARCSR